MFKDIAELREQIRKFGLQAHEEKLVALAKPAIRMLPTPVDEDAIPLGASKLGGNPDLPADFEWKYYQGKPLTFIGQFKLSELAPFDVDKELPAQGMLYYFCDIWESYQGYDAQQLVYFESEDMPLSRIIHPQAEALYGMIKALPAHQLDFAFNLALPVFLYEKNYLIADIDFTDDEDKRYWDLSVFNFDQPRHYFLGYSYPIQFPIEEPLSQLLFQIDSDDSLNLMWGDVGTVYICILKTSLAKKQFGSTYTWTEMQSH